MAKYKSVIITNAGLAIVAAAHSGDTIEFTSMKAGNGTYDGTEILEDMASLKSVKQTFGISGISREAAVTKVRSVLSNEGVTEGYYLTEIGLYALDPDTETEMLYAIVIAEDGVADYFPPYSDSPQSMTLEVYISTTGLAEGVTFTASIVEGTYMTVQDFEDYREEAEAALAEKLDRNVFYIEKGTINQSISNVDTKVSKHTGNENNPHNVTKEQIGLGNVDNTADMDKPMSTAAKKAFQEHTNNTDNPHNVTAEQVGLGNVDNTSDKDKPVSDAMQAEIDKLKQAIIDVDAMNEVSGSPILLTDTASGVLEDIEVYGRSTQTQYTGKNLLENTATTQTVGGLTFTVNEDKSVTVNGTATTQTVVILNPDFVLPNEEYIVSGGNGYVTVVVRKSDGNFIASSNGNDVKFTITNEIQPKNVIIYVSGSFTGEVKIYPMIRLASVTDSTYEPYVGGTISPNPSYPQAIKSVGDMGYFDGELLQGLYSNGVFTSNANYVCSKNAIPCNEGDKIKVTYGTIAQTILTTFFDRDMKFISSNVGSSVSEYEVSAPTNTAYVHFNINENSSANTPQTAKHICVTINDKYALIVDSKGKNELQPNNVSYASYGVYITTNDDGSQNIKGTTTTDVVVTVAQGVVSKGTHILSGFPSGVSGYIYLVDINKNALLDVMVTGGEETTFTLAETTYIKANMVTPKNITYNHTAYPMIRPQGTDATYEPYKKSRKYIPISAPLRGIGEVTDVASLSECEARKRVKATLNNTQWFVTSATVQSDTILFQSSLAIAIPASAIGDIICTHFVEKEYDSMWVVDTEGIGMLNSGTTSYLRLRVKRSRLDSEDVNGLTTFLANNPIEIEYTRAEPTTESIEPIDVDTFEGVTQISIIDNADMWVQYYSNSNVGQRLAKTNAELDKMNEHIVTSEKAISNLEDFASTATADIEDIQSNIELLQGYTDWVIIKEARELAGSGGSTGTITNDIKYKLKNSIVYLSGKLDALHWVGAPQLPLGTIDVTIAPTEDMYFNLVGIDSTDVEHAIPMVLKIASTGEVTVLKNMSGKSIVNDICINVSYPIDYTGAVG